MRLLDCLRPARAATQRHLGTLFVAAVVASTAPARTHAEAFVVRLKPAHDAGRGAILAARDAGIALVGSLADAGGTQALAQAVPVSPFDLDPPRTFLLEASDSAAAAWAGAQLAARADVAWVERVQTREAAVVSLRGVREDGASVPKFASGELVALATPAAPSEAPDDPLFRDTRQWGLWNAGPGGAYAGADGADVRALEAWRLSTGSPGVRLAIADTGLDPAHPDLAADVAADPGGHFFAGPRIVDGLNLTSTDRNAWADSSGHGTPVAGVMAALTNDGPHFDSLGVAGVAGGDGRGNPGCRIVPIKIARVRTATSWDIAVAILHATDRGARALNLSFAGGGPSRLEREALYHAITRGCVVVAAAGNKGASTPTAPMYPAAYAADGLCIAVGASDPRDRRAAFSSYGPGLDLVAPGLDVWTTFMTYPAPNGTRYNGYVAGSGTSFAAPFVTGAIGLLAAARPELRDTDFQRVLRESATDVGAPGVDAETGWGRLDLAAALRAVPATFGVWHDEFAATRVEPLALDTLVVGERGPGTMDRVRLWPSARLVAVSATVALPDSFVDSVRVWPRVGGTMAVRGGFALPYFAPWAEVVEGERWNADDGGARRFTLRGYLYRDEAPAEAGGDAGADDERWLPLPPDQVRFGFTVIGRVRREAEPTAPASTTLSAAPNPFRASVRLSGAGPLVVHDLAGRRVRRLAAGSGEVVWWDGRDDSGRGVAPGIYLVATGSSGGRLKLLKVE